MSKDETYIEQAQREIKESGISEVDLRDNLPGVEDIWKEIQRVKVEMNAAKKKAAEEAAAPYLEQLKELEDQYALVLKLSA